MFDDLDESLRSLLKAEIPITNGEVEIAFDQPTREWSARLSRPALNLFLYDVRENASLRQQGWERLPPPRDGLSLRKRSPFRVDCFYLLTVWANDPGDEHRLLSRAMLALLRNPHLPEEHLQGAMQAQAFDIPVRIGDPETLSKPSEVWSALDNEMRPAIVLQVTVALDPWQPVSGPAVRTLSLRAGQSRSPRREALDARPPAPLTFIGGTVRADSPQGAPLAGVRVAIQGRGLTATTNEAGEFVLGSLPPGTYVLHAEAPGGGSIRRKVEIPGEEYNLILKVPRKARPAKEAQP